MIWEQHQNEVAIGEFGGGKVIIYVDPPSSELEETLDSLDSYPILDENRQSELAMEVEQEAWESWGERAFKKDVLDPLLNWILADVPSDVIEEFVDDLDADRTYAAWHLIAEYHGDGSGWEESNGWYFPFKNALLSFQRAIKKGDEDPRGFYGGLEDKLLDEVGWEAEPPESMKPI